MERSGGNDDAILNPALVSMDELRSRFSEFRASRSEQIRLAMRIVATINVFDKRVLFEMSYALMRRFAFIEVPSPSDTVFEELIELWAEESEQAVDVTKDLLSVRQIKDIGPAVYRDIAHFAAQRLRLGEADESQLRFQSFYSYLLPQFGGINDEDGERLFKVLTNAIGAPQRHRIRTTLNTVLGLELVAPDTATQDLAGEVIDGVEPLPN